MNKKVNERTIREEVVEALRKGFEGAGIDTFKSEGFDGVENFGIVMNIGGKEFQIIISKIEE